MGGVTVHGAEFRFDPEKIPRSRKLRCRALNVLDAWAGLCGGSVPLLGEEFDARQACLQFVRFREILDLTFDPSKNVWRDPIGFTTPDKYVKLMLPGIRFSTDGIREAETVDPELVLGCPWRQHPPPADPHAEMDRLDRPRPENVNRADYYRVGDLPLFIAREGKNRVDLFRQHKRKIAADVSRQTPDRLPLLCRDLSGTRWLAAWTAEGGARMLGALPFPSVTFPIYRLLGAEVRSERLPIAEGELEASLLATMQRLMEAVAIQ